MKMSADGTRSGEGRSSRGSTEHEYDAFLSFRGSDTRKGIADQENPMGSQSKISIPILCENYAASEWCLRERVQMVENRKSTGHLTGRFGEAFHSQMMCFEQRDVEAGQQALRVVSFLKGWESERIANGVLKRFRPFVLREMARMR